MIGKEKSELKGLFKPSEELKTLEDQGVIKKIYKSDDIELGTLPTDRP